MIKEIRTNMNSPHLCRIMADIAELNGLEVRSILYTIGLAMMDIERVNKLSVSAQIAGENQRITCAFKREPMQ